MDGLSEHEVVALWEQGRRSGPLSRADLLAAAARPELSASQRDAMTIGARDALLLELRIATYGRHATAFLPCPSCGEALEAPLDLATLRHSPPDASPSVEVEVEVEDAPWRVVARVPTVQDVRVAAAAGDRAALLERIVVSAERAGDRVAPGALPPSIVSALEAALEARDPQADIRLAQQCPACGHGFTSTFDVASFLWHEVDVDARRVVDEIDRIAFAYGWSEAEILALGRTRRATYMEVLAAR